jgi:GDP-mannose 6-dehydrogenase
MNIVVLGAGYVGCVSAACFARLGHRVIAVDVEPSKIDALRGGHSPILEPDLDELIGEVVASGRLTGTVEADLAIAAADAVMICVGTPSQRNGSLDTRAMTRVLETIVRASRERRHKLPVAIRSTIVAPVLRQLVAQCIPDEEESPIRIVSNPEFLRETSAIADFFHPPFVLAGGDDAEAVNVVLAMYEGVDGPRHRVSLETASVVKYACNAFHALKISFANEMASFSSVVGADPLEVMRLVRQDKVLNISPAYLKPGFAFGGSCLPKDLRALTAVASAEHEPLPLLSSILPSNQRRIEQVLETIVAAGPRRLAMLGLSFKLGSDDMRESPYVELAERLIGKGFELRIFDPDIEPERLLGSNRAFACAHLPHISRLLVSTPGDALARADAVILCKRVLAGETLRALMNPDAAIFDLEYHARELGLHTASRDAAVA